MNIIISVEQLDIVKFISNVPIQIKYVVALS